MFTRNDSMPNILWIWDITKFKLINVLIQTNAIKCMLNNSHWLLLEPSTKIVFINKQVWVGIRREIVWLFVRTIINSTCGHRKDAYRSRRPARRTFLFNPLSGIPTAIAWHLLAKIISVLLTFRKLKPIHLMNIVLRFSFFLNFKYPYFLQLSIMSGRFFIELSNLQSKFQLNIF